MGALVGVLLALGLNQLSDPASAALGADLQPFDLPAAVALAFGAMCGDIGASFLKRRSGRERGAAFPGLDQLDFVVGALGLAFLVDTDWALAVFAPRVLAVVLVMTPLLHVVTNVGAYAVGLKNEPW